MSLHQYNLELVVGTPELPWAVQQHSHCQLTYFSI